MIFGHLYVAVLRSLLMCFFHNRVINYAFCGEKTFCIPTNYQFCHDYVATTSLSKKTFFFLLVIRLVVRLHCECIANIYISSCSQQQTTADIGSLNYSGGASFLSLHTSTQNLLQQENQRRSKSKQGFSSTVMALETQALF